MHESPHLGSFLVSCVHGPSKLPVDRGAALPPFTAEIPQMMMNAKLLSEETGNQLIAVVFAFVTPTLKACAVLYCQPGRCVFGNTPIAICCCVRRYLSPLCVAYDARVSELEEGLATYERQVHIPRI